MARSIRPVGREGRTLDDVWGHDDATAHLGITVPGFPNFFLMQGPSTGLGHGGSAIFQAESQTRYITDAIVRMRSGATTSLRPSGVIVQASSTSSASSNAPSRICHLNNQIALPIAMPSRSRVCPFQLLMNALPVSAGASSLPDSASL